MKDKIMASMLVLFLVLSLAPLTLNFVPIVFGEPGSVQREVWKVVDITNTLPYDTLVDLNVTVNSRTGVNIACSNGTTAYFSNLTYWQGQGYSTYMEWLNGTGSLMYHWGEMNWHVSNGSLTSIAYNEIQFWGPMYFDSGGGVSYTTFMGNTYMADWNLTSPNNDPDIIYQASWQGNQIKIIDDMIVPMGATANIVFKIVLTEPGGYTFNLTATAGVTVSPSTWTIGGLNTILVPYDKPTIQAAIDASKSGDTIVVYGGTYAEDLNIPAQKSNLDIKTFPGEIVTVKGVQNLPVASWPQALPNIAINGSGTKLHGFTIEGPDYEAGHYASGIVVGAANVQIFDNNFKVTAGTTTDEISQAIQTWHYTAVPGIDISGLDIRNNTFTHLNSGSAGYEATYVNLDTGNAAIKIWNNTFVGNVVRAITTERSNTIISGNNIITDLAPGLPGGYQGINVGGVNSGNVTNVSVVGNKIKGSGTGKGFQYGIKVGYAVSSVLTAVTVTNNTVQMNDVGVRVRFSADGVIVKWNNFDNNTIYGVLNEDSAHMLNAAYNWWGDKTGPYHAALNPTGTGNNVSDNVIFTPWLTKPHPPVTPVTVVYVNPQNVTLEAPALGTAFTIDVTIANVSLMYGYQFKLRWNPALINLTNINVKVPAIWKDYTSQSLANYAIGNYSLFVSAYPPSSAFNGTTTVVSLTFKSVYDPAYPNNVTCNLGLEGVRIGDVNANPIIHVAYNGTYFCNTVKPKLLFKEPEYSAKKVPTEFDATVNVTKVVNLSAFNFTFEYDKSILSVLRVDVIVTASNVYSGWNPTSGLVYANVTGITTPLNGSAMLVKVRFKAVTGFIWNTETPNVTSAFNFTFHTLNDGALDHDVLNGAYIYKPVPGDMNMDGKVDIVDIVTIAGYFGTTPGGPPYSTADLNHDGLVDILDIILVARNFGRTEP